ncbi:MAG: ATP-binding protein [Muribaculaceae bacterium]|nr:ATP-binding protein [Muribaculaceae bacterium]
MEAKYIEAFYVADLWNRLNISWENVYEDVNILVGINGSGKTTLLNLIYDYYTGKRFKQSVARSLDGNPISSPVTYIRSFDIPANGKKKTESMLLQQLKNVINQNGEGKTFFDYRMGMLNFPQKAQTIDRRIKKFFRLIDEMFCETGKAVGIDPQNNALVFYLTDNRTSIGRDKDNSIDSYEKVPGDGQRKFISLDQLSSGEKQLLLILTTVFLQEETPNVLLMDEPEISLHISWQDKLITTLRELNPNCQLILTTHSPNIFANGWENKLVFMEDIESPIKNEY